MRNPNHGRLLYEWKKDPTNSAYHNIFMYSLHGKIEFSYLKQAIESLSSIYPELQAYVQYSGDNPTKKYAPSIIDSLEYQDYSTEVISIEKIQVELDAYLHLPFDLRKPPLYRYKLVKISDEHHLLGLCWYHFIDDAVSVTHLTERLSDNYNRACRGEIINVEAIHDPEDFDFTYTSEGLTYWQQKTSCITQPVIKLSTQCRIPQVQHPTKRVYFALSKEESKQLLAFCSSRYCTPFIGLMAAFIALCQRFSQQNEINLLYSVNTRKKRDAMAVGFHVNNIPMHIAFTSNMTFESLVDAVKTQREQDAVYQNVPLMEITRLLRADGKNTHFNFMMSQFTNISFPLKLNGIQCEPIPVVYNNAKNDFTFFYYYTGQTIQCEFEYRTDLFNDAFIDQLQSSFVCLLNDAINNPLCSLNELNLLSEVQYNAITNIQDNTTHYCLKVLSELFQQTAQRFPDNIALRQHKFSLNYAEVEKLSSQLAYYFLEKGYGKGSIIALLTERDITIIIAILAIFKIGAIYLPIDPDYPKERINYIIDDAKPKIVYAASELQNIISDLSVKDYQTSLLEVQLTDSCYLIYTSGSTGKPKGVLNNYLGFVNRLLWMIDYYQISSNDRFLQKTSLSFDVSLWEVFVPLLSGATLVLANKGAHKDPGRLISHVMDDEITVMHFVPTMLQAFLNICHDTNLPSLRIVACSGEELNYQTVTQFKSYFPHVMLLNLYGPTETSIEVSYWDTDDSKTTGIIPIGYALPHVKLYILNEAMQPVPIGMSGELYVGGVAVTEGYYQKPDLTMERFKTNPFTSDNSKMYKTGDVCCWIAPGCIEYLGRNDRQIKLHGFRIEIAEIEASILSHTNINNCTVMYSTMEQRSQLLAFIVMNQEVANFEELLRDYLKQKLPVYMVPAKFYLVDSIPTTTQGKVDKQALLQYMQNPITHQIQGTVTSIPLKIRTIWAEALACSLENITLDCDFIKLGGDSLSVLRIIAAIEQEYGREIPLSSLLDYPKLDEFYRWLMNHLNCCELVHDPDVTIVPTDRFSLSHMQQNLLSSENSNIVLTYHWQGGLDQQRLCTAVNVLCSRHKLLQARFQHTDGEWYYYHEPYDVIEFHSVTDHELLSAAKQEEKKLRHRITDYTKDNLFHITVFSANHNHILLVYLNHMIVDRASMQLIVKELLQLYENPMQKLAETKEYFDFVIREKQILNSEHASHQLNYWLQYLNNQVRNINSTQAIIKTDCDILSCDLNNNVAAAIAALTHAYHKTPFCVLSTVFMLSLQKFLQQSDFSVGFTISKRNSTSINHTVGPIINYGMILSPNHKQSLSDMLHTTERDIINAYENSDISLSMLQTALKERGDNRVLFDIFFDYDPGHTEVYHFTDGTMRALPMGHSRHMQRYISARVFKKHDSQYGIEIRYRTSLFMREKILDLITIFNNYLVKEKEYERITY